VKTRTILLVAIALGFSAALLNWFYLIGLQGSQITLLKAKKDLPPGKPVSLDDFEQLSLFGDADKLRNVFVSSRDLEGFVAEPLARVVRTGELLTMRSYDVSGDNGIVDLLEPGERALSIDVDTDAKSVSHSVQPGDFVDVYGARQSGDVDLIASRARVIAVGDVYLLPNASGPDDRYRSITIAVAAASVLDVIAKLNVAQDRVRVVLMRPDDKPVTTPSSASASSVSAQPRAPRPTTDNPEADSNARSPERQQLDKKPAATRRPR
jgi:Flp pilus assembly protein CpaB